MAASSTALFFSAATLAIGSSLAPSQRSPRLENSRGTARLSQTRCALCAEGQEELKSNSQNRPPSGGFFFQATSNRLSKNATSSAS